MSTQSKATKLLFVGYFMAFSYLRSCQPKSLDQASQC